MASPFKVFRKNQKAWMVAITVLAMISFVFMGNIGGSARNGGAGGKDPEVFSWKYGTVNASELRNRIQLQHKVQQFLAQTARAADKPAQQADQYIVSQIPTNDNGVITAMLLNKKAEDLGIVISDQVVIAYIKEWTERKLSGQDLGKIISDLGITQPQLFDAIRFNLAATYAERTFMPNIVRSNQYMAWFHGDTPAERWEYFERLNRKATTEIMPVAVKDFVDKVPEPTATELQTFYDEYKNAYPQPGSRTPGFRDPYKAQIEYVKADNDKLLDEALPTVTADEIKDYYDKHKDTLFRKSKLPEMPDMGAKPGDATEGKSDAPDDAAKAKADEKSTPAEAAKDAKATDAKANAKSGAKSDAKSDSKSAAPKAGEKSGGAKGGSKSTKGADGKQSSAQPASSLNGELLAVADDEIYLAQKSDAKAAKSDAKADAKSAATKADAKAADAKADAKALDMKAADAKADSKAADKTDDKPAGAATPELPGREVEYDPLEKVEGQIKNLVAQQKVDERVAKAFALIEAQMGRYQSAAEAQHAAELAGKAGGKQIQAPDLEALAKENGLVYRKTGLTTMQEAYDNLDIGKSRRPLVAGSRQTPPPFVQVAFLTDSKGQPLTKLFAAEQSEDNSNNHYLWWKISEQSARTPTLDAIKADVVQAWKQIKARKLASDKADEYAKQVNKSKQTLKEAFGTAAGADVVTPGAFSWLTRPAESPFSQPRMSDVTGLDHVGYDFMKSVFKLKSGETGVAPNDPLTVYYVVQLESEEPLVETMRQNFMAAMNDPMNSMTYAIVGAAEHSNDGLSWFNELKDQYGFKMAADYKPMDARDYD
jgi:hypothetical protein